MEIPYNEDDELMYLGMIKDEFESQYEKDRLEFQRKQREFEDLECYFKDQQRIYREEKLEFEEKTRIYQEKVSDLTARPIIQKLLLNEVKKMPNQSEQSSENDSIWI